RGALLGALVLLVVEVEVVAGRRFGLLDRRLARGRGRLLRRRRSGSPAGGHGDGRLALGALHLLAGGVVRRLQPRLARRAGNRYRHGSPPYVGSTEFAGEADSSSAWG